MLNYMKAAFIQICVPLKLVQVTRSIALCVPTGWHTHTYKYMCMGY